ncbi:hypothetical protein EAE96_008732 [Botrytis aclada]|nr:hypothetical protein EAE96_008732 [Botrytis aclada]
MPSFVSTLENGCELLFTSLTSTLVTFKKRLHREVRPTLQAIVSTINRLYHLHVRPLTSRYEQFISDHILPTALGLLIILMAIIAIWPSIVTAPLLALLGFEILGPVAGSMASLTQAISGNVVVGSGFAVLQSAGMAGFGLAVINSVVGRIATGVLAVVMVHLIE